MKVQHRTVKYADHNGLCHRIYKFETNEGLNDYLQDFSTFFKKSIQVIYSGKFCDEALGFLKVLENDNLCEDLNLQKGDFYIITRENSALKVDEQVKKEKKLKQPIQPENQKEKQVMPQQQLTAEEVKFLYSAPISQLVQTLQESGQKVTYASIYNKRKKHEMDNPDFIVPEHATGRAKQVEPKHRFSLKDLNETQVQILWNNSIADAKRLLNLTVFQIRDARIEYCKLHPDFVIPRVSGFNLDGVVNNQIEPKQEKEKVNPNDFTAEELSVIWDGTGKEVAEVLDKSYQAVYHNRVAYCKANPSFVIPAKAQFTPTAELQNKVEVVEKTKRAYNKKEKPVIQDIKMVTTKPEDFIGIPKVIQPAVTASEIPATAQETPVDADLLELFTAMKQTGIKPKNLSYKGIKMDF